MTRFFRQPNLATDRVYPIDEPWNFKVPEDKLALPKDQYKAYYKNPGTDHCLLYMVQGQNPDYTVTVGNQAAVLYGFMADYDGVLTDDLIDELKRKKQSRYQPAYWCKSQSGKLHLFWFFERPISVASNAHANALLKIVSRKIKAPMWAVGYDPNCEIVTQCMDIGKEWHVFREDAVIPAEEIVLWDFALFEAGAKGVTKDVVSIPFEVVAAEVRNRKWPGHVPQDFRVGTRCVRFWDPTADNVSGAQITKDGIRVYTPHDNGFKSWRSLLGSEFCEQYVAKSTAPFIEETFYCHTKDTYWRFFRQTERNQHARFEQRTEKMLRREMILEAQLSDKIPKGEELSDVAKMLDSIVKKNSVDAVAPILYRKAGTIYVPELGKTILNTSLVSVVPPVPRLASVTTADLDRFPNCPKKYLEDPLACKWDNPFAVQGFPNIHRFLTTLFIKSQAVYDRWERDNFPLHGKSGDPFAHLCDDQLMHLISWMSHFFRMAARSPVNPGRGQALIIVGPQGVGKSFFARTLLGTLMGGSVDADKFYLEGSRFNEGTVTAPVHVIDDRLGSKTSRCRLQFTEALKVVVANATLRYEAKFGSALESVPWAGRVVILANDDAVSMSVMPDLDMSTRDKFMMLKFGGASPRWPEDFSENMKWLLAELPYFARFLLNWEIPTEMRDNRFGVKAIQHPDMAQASAENGLTEVLANILEICIEHATGSKDEAELSDVNGWACEGNSVKVFRWIRSVDESFVREIIDSRTLNQCLQILYKSGGYNIGFDQATKRWLIPYVLRKVQKPS